MSKSHFYAVSYEDNESGGVDKLFDNFIDAVYHAIKLFGELLPCEKDRDRFLEVCADPEFLARVDVYECKDIDDACAKFFDAVFISLFHLDNDMYYR